MFSLTQINIETPDDNLIEQFKTRHAVSSLDILFRRYSHLVFCLCQKYLKNTEDSKDAVMEIFENLSIDLEKHDISNFKNWLYVLAKNHCLLKLRRSTYQNTAVKKNEEIEKLYVENPTLMHRHNEQEIQNHDLYIALKQLNEKQKTCLELFYFKEKTYKEIAETTNFAVHQVKSYIQNGRRNLKYMLN